MKNSYFWFLCFSIIFFLSLDFWFWQSDVSFSLFYLPAWVIYFIGLQLFISFTMIVFALTFWKTPLN